MRYDANGTFFIKNKVLKENLIEGFNTTKNPSNDYKYTCSTGGSYATYNENTLTAAQKKKAEETWPGQSAPYYACAQGCAGQCTKDGYGIMKDVKNMVTNGQRSETTSGMIYTTDGKVGVGTRNPTKELDINGDIRMKNLCMLNNNGEEICINAAFLVLAKELILGVIPKEYRDLNLLNSMSINDLSKKLIPDQMNSENDEEF